MNFTTGLWTELTRCAEPGSGMMENCRLHGIDPMAYLTDVMPRLVDRDAGADVSDLSCRGSGRR